MASLNQSWVAAGLLALALVLGLGLVWCNIERLDLAYEMKVTSEKLSASEEVAAKLEIERDNLVSPHRLRALARKYGLKPAGQGRMRQLAPADKENGGVRED